PLLRAFALVRTAGHRWQSEHRYRVHLPLHGGCVPDLCELLRVADFLPALRRPGSSRAAAAGSRPPFMARLRDALPLLLPAAISSRTPILGLLLSAADRSGSHDRGARVDSAAPAGRRTAVRCVDTVG